ncbi:MAG TPA: hypothetical protein DHW49_10115 [Anaerolineae bacterium]|nr:hypothetical protein [Anaerolineae bacterium]
MVIKERRKRKDFWKVESGKWYLFLLSSFLISCSTPQPTTPNQVITINYSPFTENQMNEVYACANDLSIILKISEEPDIRFQLGEPEILLGNAYQIGEEEIVVVVNQQSELGTLSLNEVQNLFASGENVWVYAEGEEMQRSFDQFVMSGRSVSSSAEVVPNPKIMIQVLEENPNAVGFIPESLLTQNLKEIYSVGNFPVLAIPEVEPQGAVKSLIGCLQDS